MYKKIRKYWWLLQNLAKKQFLFILLGAVINFAVLFLTLSLINSHIFSKTKKIGIVQNYTIKTMPEEITRLISRGLTKINSKGSYEVDIADKVTIRNEGKIYDIKLKKNVYWQNGKQFTTKDINYNFKNVNFVAKNDFEGYFILKEKYAPFLQLLSIPITDDKLNGVGDYKVARIEFDGDFIKAVYLTGPEKFTYRFYPSQKIAITAFKLGEVNILKYLNSFENVKIWKKVAVKKESDPTHFAAIFFSFKSNSPVTEKNLRQALAYDINRKNFNEKPAYSSYAYNSPFYNENIKKYFFDEASSLNLYEKFQGDKPKKISLTLYTNSDYEKYATAIAKEWEKNLKIKVNVRSTQSFPYQWQAFLTVSEIPKDPDQYTLWHSNRTFRFSNYRNLKIDKLLEDGRVEIDPEKRKEIYAELQKTLTEDLPAIFLFYPNSYTLSY